MSATSHGVPNSASGDIDCARLTPPRWQAHHLTRPRVTSLLADCVRFARITEVEAPSGCGKSIALADLARSHRTGPVWLTLAAHDRIASQLVRDLAWAVHEAQHPSLDRSKRGTKPSDSCDALQGSYVTCLANQLARDCAERVVILDNADVLCGTDEAIAIVSDLISQTPSSIRFLYASRKPLLSLFAHTVCVSETSRVDQATLAFTLDETHALFEQLGVHERALRSALARAADCDGWPAATAIVGKHFRVTRHAQSAEDTQLDEALGELVERQLRNCTQEQVNLLGVLANVEHVTPHVCATILNLEKADDRLAELKQRCAFVRRRDLTGTYAISRIAREHLLRRSRGAAGLSAEQHLRLAACSRSADDAVACIKHLLAAGEVDEAKAVLDEASASLVTSGRWQAIADCVESLQRKAALALPLTTLHLMVRAQIALARAGDAVVTASHAIRRSDASLDDLVRLYLTRSFAHRYAGDTALAREDAERALHCAEVVAPELRVKAVRLVGTTAASQLDIRAAERYFDDGLAVAQEHGLERQRALLLCDAAALEYIKGDADASIHCALMALSIAKASSYLVAVILARNNLACAYRLKGDYVSAMAELDAVIDLASRSQQPRLLALAWIEKGALDADLTRWTPALAALRCGLRAARALGEPEVVAYARRGLLECSCRAGELDEARGLLREIVRVPAPNELGRVLDRVAEGALYVEERACSTARPILTQAAQRFSAAGAMASLASTHLYLAFVESAESNIVAALPHLEIATSITRRLGNAAFLYPIAARMPLLWDAVVAVGRSDFVSAFAPSGTRLAEWGGVRSTEGADHAAEPSADLLTSREREIVAGLCEGLSRDAIAERIGRSRSTLDKAISMIYSATGFSHAHQLVAWAFRIGFIPANAAPPIDALQWAPRHPRERR